MPAITLLTTSKNTLVLSVSSKLILLGFFSAPRKSRGVSQTRQQQPRQAQQAGGPAGRAELL